MSEPEQKPVTSSRPRRLPDKYLAITIWLILLAVYLWSKDDAVKQMMVGAFALVCAAIGDGLRRVADSFKSRWGKRDGNEQR